MKLSQEQVKDSDSQDLSFEALDQDSDTQFKKMKTQGKMPDQKLQLSNQISQYMADENYGVYQVEQSSCVDSEYREKDN